MDQKPQAQVPQGTEIARDEARRAASNGGGEPAKEIGGRGGLDPTRYGDWEKNGRCIDF